MKQIKYSCSSECGRETQMPYDSNLLRQLNPFYPWIQHPLYCVECGFDVYIEIIDKEESDEKVL